MLDDLQASSNKMITHGRVGAIWIAVGNGARDVIVLVKRIFCMPGYKLKGAEWCESLSKISSGGGNA